MKNTKKTLNIPPQYQEMALYLEALNYEVVNIGNLLIFALNEDLKHTDSFARYEGDYQDFYIKYDLAKREFERCVIRELLAEDEWQRPFNWHLCFEGDELIISWGEDIQA